VPPLSTALPASSVSLVRTPYLTAAARDSMTILWRTSTPTDTQIEYGTAGSSQVAGNPAASETSHKVTITGLTAGTAYNYRVVTKPTGVWQQIGNANTFTTAAAATAPSFSVVAFGDSGQGTSAQSKVANLIANETFDFAMHTGDVIYPSGAAADYDTNFFPQYNGFLGSHPIFGAIGNHDLETQTGQPYIDVFTPPTNNPQGSSLYYSFEWGNAKFISIDSTNTFQSSGPWGTWFQSELANNTRRWLVVFMHAPLFSNDTTHGDDTTLQGLWQSMIEQYKVDLVVAGHGHIYQRTNKIKMFSTDPSYGGWVEIVTGGGGAALYGTGAATAATPAYTESVNHYTKLTFTQNELQVKVVRASGTVAESVVIPHN
jgi:hypothetical protein